MTVMLSVVTAGSGLEGGRGTFTRSLLCARARPEGAVEIISCTSFSHREHTPAGDAEPEANVRSFRLPSPCSEKVPDTAFANSHLFGACTGLQMEVSGRTQ